MNANAEHITGDTGGRSTHTPKALKARLHELIGHRETIDEEIQAIEEHLGESDDPAVAASPQDDGLAALEAKCAELDEQYQRALADYQNFQRRSIENEQEARRQGVVSAVESLLPALDNFGLALNADPNKTSAQQVLDGVNLIRDEILSAMGTLGLTRIEPKANDEFDPSLHAAVLQAPAEGVAPGRIAAAMQPGYKLGSRILRPAMVSVAPQTACCENQGDAPEQTHTCCQENEHQDADGDE